MKRAASTLCFVRRCVIRDTSVIYEQRTEVWVIGNREGYDMFIRKINQVLSRNESTHIASRVDRGSLMRVVLIPAQNTKARCPRLRFIERCVSFRRRVVMELVIVANTSGYEYLVEKFVKMRNMAGKTTEHLHLSDWTDPYVVGGSVALNVRSAVLQWTDRNIVGLGRQVVSSREKSILRDVYEYHDPKEKYQEFDPCRLNETWLRRKKTTAGGRVRL